MKYFVLLILLLSGCATRTPVDRTPAISYTELTKIKVSNKDCPRIDQVIDYLDLQLKRRGLYGRDPVGFTEEQRLYNARAQSLIWSLRVGCSNPDRYKK